MALQLVPVIAIAVLVSLTLFDYVLRPALQPSLARIPAAHWSAPFSSLWVLEQRLYQKDVPAIHAAHQRLGPVLRIAPNELSLNSVDGGIRSVYGGSFEKGDWYLNAFTNYGVMPMFAIPDHQSHSKRKRMLSNIYAKSTLQSSQAMDRITDTLINGRMVPKLKEMSRSNKHNDLYMLFSALAMDFTAAYLFGLRHACNYTQQPDTANAKFVSDYQARKFYLFWPQELPRFTSIMYKLGLGHLLVPRWASQAYEDTEAWLLGMCDEAEVTVRKAEVEGYKGNVEDWPTVYSQLRSALLKEEGTKASDGNIDGLARRHRLTIASEMLDHALAGFDTSSITLIFLAWELSMPHNAHWQDRLHSELATLKGSRDAETIDKLPILHAVLMETLRLHAAIPGNQPRITPAQVTLGAPGHSFPDLPPNIRVQSQAWSLHRNPDVYPDPESWRPERWLESSEDQLREMRRWFWAFGSGGRMCVGSNLAMLDMKAIATGLWADFRTTVVDDSGMLHNGGYIADPVGKDGKYCLLAIEEI